jgi:hypothetical protein
VPLEVVAVHPDLLLYLPPHGGLIVTRLHVLSVGINKTGSSG